MLDGYARFFKESILRMLIQYNFQMDATPHLVHMYFYPHRNYYFVHKDVVQQHPSVHHKLVNRIRLVSFSVITQQTSLTIYTTIG